MIFGSRLDGESDGRLVALAAQGDQRAFGELLKRHQGAVYGFAFRFLNDPQDAEDIAQEVFLRLFRAAGGYKPRASLRTYLFRIARNLCIDSLRKKRPEPMEELPEAIDPKTPFDKLSEAESFKRLLDAISSLPDNQRAAILLRHNQGLNYREIAEALDVTVSAVESLLVRARRTLRARLADLC